MKLNYLHIRFVVLICLVICSNEICAQHSKKKYEFGILGGWNNTVAKRGPRLETPVSKVNYLRPVRKSFGFRMDVSHHKRITTGLEFMYDEFDLGYRAFSNGMMNPSGSHSSMLAVAGRIMFYKVGLRMGYVLHSGSRFSWTGVLIPSLGYYPYSDILNDTSGNDRDPRREIQFIQTPPVQNQGLKLVVKTSLEMNYSFKGNISAFMTLSYQQGFFRFFTDTTNIVRPYEPGGPKEHKYWTTLNGSGVQFHFGIKYSL